MIKGIILFIFLVINYYILVGLLISYRIEGYPNLFYILISLVVVERLISTIRGCAITTDKPEKCRLLKNIILNLFFFDYSVMYFVVDDYKFYNYDTFISLLSFLSHAINGIPIIQNLWIYLNHSVIENKFYLIAMIYGFALMLLAELLHHIKEKKEKNILRCIYRLISNASRKVSFFIIVSQLISYNLGFISIFGVLLIIEIISFCKIIGESLGCYLFLRYPYFSYEVKNEEDELILSTGLNTALVILFIINIGLNHDSSTYNIVLYVSFCFTLIEILPTFYYAHRYFTKGPFILELSVEFSQNTKNKKLTAIQQKMKSATMSREANVYITIHNEIEIKDKQLIKFFCFFLSSFQEHKKLLVTVKGQKQQLFEIHQSYKKISLNYNNMFVETGKEFTKDFIQGLQDSLFNHNTDNEISFNFKANSKHFDILDLKKLMLSENICFYPYRYKIGNQRVNFIVHQLIAMMNIRLIQKRIIEYIPINLGQFFYDLYD